MIKNERQYRITKAQAAKFERALAELSEQSGDDAGVHPLLRKAHEDALRSQLADLHQQLEEYETLQSGELPVLTLSSLEELPLALIKARIASGLSQKDLAERLGLKEQQIQRYEATEYTSASLTRVKEVIKALHIEVQASLTRADCRGEEKRDSNNYENMMAPRPTSPRSM